MKPGKYVGAAFTPDQLRARAMAQKALKMRVTLADALMYPPDKRTREWLHTRLDWYIDSIERLDNEARKLFPEVEESFIVARMTIRL